METITELGDATVPSLLKIAQDDDEEIAKQARQDLYNRWRRLYEKGAWNDGKMRYNLGKLKPFDYRGYNTVSYQARQLLLDNGSSYPAFTAGRNR